MAERRGVAEDGNLNLLERLLPRAFTRRFFRAGRGLGRAARQRIDRDVPDATVPRCSCPGRTICPSPRACSGASKTARICLRTNFLPACRSGIWLGAQVSSGNVQFVLRASLPARQKKHEIQIGAIQRLAPVARGQTESSPSRKDCPARLARLAAPQHSWLASSDADGPISAGTFDVKAVGTNPA